MHEEPQVGASYEDPDCKVFKVTAFDEDEGTVVIEYESGATESLDIDAWYDLDLEMIDDGEESDKDDGVALDDEDDLDYDEDEDFDEDEQ